jgi:hypothetical protein
MNSFYMEGNKGGDYLSIKAVSNQMLRIEVGHQCVVHGRYRMPVEVLTAVLGKFLNDGPENAELPGADEYNQSLRRKIFKEEKP